MTIRFTVYDGIPGEDVLAGLVRFHERIFGSSDDLAGRMREKPKLHIVTASDEQTIVGYKIGYALNREQFYSWLGGVDPEYRSRGIASELMDRQHQHAKASGYRSIQTQTKNKWRDMLILNLKHGFDVIGTYTDSEGEPKIILEKNFADSNR
ncbi:GNAT family N-acetyltransferase [Indiicoccus explosivorum]|uniref:GNAT family N-acetyltransferase n=1 Tax=Indiicoccus explosivorum TaxID=1917864 RepID=UPI003B985D24